MVKLSLCLTNQALRHEGVWGSGRTDPYFLNLGTSWRWEVSCTPLPLYPRGKSLRYPLDRRLGGPREGLDDEEKTKFLTFPGLELWPLCRPARSQSLYRLCYPGSKLYKILCKAQIFFVTSRYDWKPKLPMYPKWKQTNKQTKNLANRIDTDITWPPSKALSSIYFEKNA
jgi:hypothetical protein